MSIRPNVSVLIAAYNHEKYVREAVESAVRQDYGPLEVVVVDDASTDRTADIVGEVADRFPDRIVFHRRTENKGFVPTINECLSLSRGTIFIATGSDDVLPPGAISARVHFLNAHPEVDVVVSDFDLIVGQHQRVYGLEKLKVVSQFARLYQTPADGYYNELLRGNFMPCGAVTVRTGRIPVTEMKQDEHCPALSDLDLWLRLARSYCWAYLPVSTWQYRWHGENMSSPNKHSCATAFRQQVYILAKQLTLDKSQERRLFIMSLITHLVVLLRQADTTDPAEAQRSRSDFRSETSAARTAYDAGNFNESLRICQQILSVKPDCSAAWHIVGISAFAMGNVPESARHLFRALSTGPTVIEYGNDLAVVLLALGMPKAAISVCHRMIAISPNDAAVQETLSEAMRSPILITELG